MCLKFCISLAVCGSDVHCFSCFGYDEDGHTKCHSQETGELFVRTCTTNTTCIEYTATYNVPQMMGKTLKKVPATIHGLFCGTNKDCDKNVCPNFWPKDVVDTKCDVTCCHPDKDRETCSFPLPTADDIARHKGEAAGVSGVSAKAGARGRESGVARVSQSVWLQAVSFAIFGLFKL